MDQRRREVRIHSLHVTAAALASGEEFIRCELIGPERVAFVFSDPGDTLHAFIGDYYRDRVEPLPPRRVLSALEDLRCRLFATLHAAWADGAGARAPEGAGR